MKHIKFFSLKNALSFILGSDWLQTSCDVINPAGEPTVLSGGRELCSSCVKTTVPEEIH
ncbi:hypothetical protein INR49_020608 [Caranx melampygus]|nr:hypothetical protein INR49_020608 [Caranx melampygus]